MRRVSAGALSALVDARGWSVQLPSAGGDGDNAGTRIWFAEASAALPAAPIRYVSGVSRCSVRCLSPWMDAPRHVWQDCDCACGFGTSEPPFFSYTFDQVDLDQGSRTAEPGNCVSGST